MCISNRSTECWMNSFISFYSSFSSLPSAMVLLLPFFCAFHSDVCWWGLRIDKRLGTRVQINGTLFERLLKLRSGQQKFRRWSFNMRPFAFIQRRIHAEYNFNIRWHVSACNHIRYNDNQQQQQPRIRERSWSRQKSIENIRKLCEIESSNNKIVVLLLDKINAWQRWLQSAKSNKINGSSLCVFGRRAGENGIYSNLQTEKTVTHVKACTTIHAFEKARVTHKLRTKNTIAKQAA